MALGILGAMGAVGRTDEGMLVGELSFDSTLRTVRGVLSMAVCARRQGIPNLLVPADNASEAAVAEGVNAYGMRHVAEVVTYLISPINSTPRRPAPRRPHYQTTCFPIAAKCSSRSPPRGARSSRRPQCSEDRPARVREDHAGETLRRDPAAVTFQESIETT
jgi:hypothetical protein